MRNFTKTHISGNQYRLNWTRPSNPGNDPVRTYHYFYADGCPGTGAASRPYQVSDPDQVNFEATVYTAGSEFSMNAENSAGTGPCRDAN